MLNSLQALINEVINLSLRSRLLNTIAIDQFSGTPKAIFSAIEASANKYLWDMGDSRSPRSQDLRVI